jgi:hypothetical protein
MGARIENPAKRSDAAAKGFVDRIGSFPFEGRITPQSLNEQYLLLDGALTYMDRCTLVVQLDVDAARHDARFHVHDRITVTVP